MTNKELLKAYSAYLPYKINWFVDFEDGDTAVYEMMGLFTDSGDIYLDEYETNVDSEKKCKPILRPLSDLTKEIEHNGEKFVPVEFLNSELITIDYFEDTDHYEYLMSWINSVDKSHHINFLPFGLIQKLLEWHFDIFNLREKDCCIYYN